MAELKRRKKAGKQLTLNQQYVAGTLLNRINLSKRMGLQYKGVRKVYEALGYPEDTELDYAYFWNKYERQDVANAVIARPVDKTWDGELAVVEPDTKLEDSQLYKAWKDLNEELKIKSKLSNTDKLVGIGHYSVLLLGFSDVKEEKEFMRPVSGQSLKLLYVTPIQENLADIKTFDTNPSSPRYGMPEVYGITLGVPGKQGSGNTIEVHHSRVLHIAGQSLTSDIYGTPRLKPIINRLLDLEKILGGSAETYWRGARPGFQAVERDGYQMGDAEMDALDEEIEKYEHDLRRFITMQGADLKALEQQIADPLGHIDAQLQAISAQTGIPKRILIGSERGELSSSQDETQWLSLITTRMEEWAEPYILRPFVDKCMEHGILPKVEKYNVLWEDLFSPSEKEKVEIGKGRAESLAKYASAITNDLLPPEMALKHIFGFSEEQVEEILVSIEEMAEEEDEAMEDPPTNQPQEIEEEEENEE